MNDRQYREAGAVTGGGSGAAGSTRHRARLEQAEQADRAKAGQVKAGQGGPV